MVLTRQDVVRAVKKLGQRGAYFQFRDLRKELGVDPTDNSYSRLSNCFRQLFAEGMIAESDNEKRKRHKYYKLVPPASGTGREVDRLARMEKRLEHIEARLDVLAVAWT